MSTEELLKASSSAIKEAVEDGVKSGEITKEQAFLFYAISSFVRFYMDLMKGFGNPAFAMMAATEDSPRGRLIRNIALSAINHGISRLDAMGITADSVYPNDGIRAIVNATAKELMKVDGE